MINNSKKIIPLVIISPVRDESKLIRKTLDSVVNQTLQPVEWILVDDGSTDNTREIIKEFSIKYNFIKLVIHENRGFRKLGGGVIAAFKFGLSNINYKSYEFIAKLDGDMSFDSKYLEIMFQKFDEDSKLAAVSGKVFRPENEKLISEWIGDEHVAGQFKIYRRAAFEEIGGFVEEVMWDGIDVHMSRMKNWNTQSFYHPEARLFHHRLMGSSDKNVLKGRLRWGRGIYFMGYHPLYALASGFFRMQEKPKIIGGVLIIFGFFKASIQKVPRYDNLEFRSYLQKWQINQLKRWFFG